MRAGGGKVMQGVKDNKLGFALVILILYFFFEYVRPFMPHLIPVLSPFRIPMILTVILLIFFLKHEKSLLRDKLVIYVLLFVLLVGFSVVYARNTYYVWSTFKGLSIILVAITLTMPLICDDKRKFYIFIYAWVACNLLLVLHALKYNGHGPGGFVWDENDLALALNMCTPVSYYFFIIRRNANKSGMLPLAATLLLVVGSGSTMSRGGFLGLVAVFGMIWLLSERKLKSFGIVLLCALIAGYPVYKLVPETYKNEMSTIFEDKGNDSTRSARFEFWGYGWDMFLDNPVLGIGAANYPWTVDIYQMRKPDYNPNTMRLHGGRPAHSLYFTLIPELGLAGIIIFVLIIKEVFARLRRLILLGRKHEALSEYAMLAKALLVSAIAFLVTGAFISVLYYPPFWYLIAFLLTLERIADTEYKKIENEDEDAPKGNSHNRDGGTRWRREYSGADRPRLEKRV